MKNFVGNAVVAYNKQVIPFATFFSLHFYLTLQTHIVCFICRFFLPTFWH